MRVAPHAHSAREEDPESLTRRPVQAEIVAAGAASNSRVLRALRTVRLLTRSRCEAAGELLRPLRSPGAWSACA
ncbi:MAG: hypothetical protein ABR538_07515, partial [Candidatus Binatia bacterium]